MDAEKAAHDFYMEMSKLYEENLRIKKTIEYIATMELGHFKLLEIEKQNMKNSKILMFTRQCFMSVLKKEELNFKFST